MNAPRFQRKRLSYQLVRASALHCCVPRCSCSSRYNSQVSFHSFPVRNAVRQRWLVKIRRGKYFSPSKGTRVCSRHFLPEDVVDTPGGKKWLKKDAVPILFEWNNYTPPEPRTGVWGRKSPAAAELTADITGAEMIAVAPLDHDYCVFPTTGLMANELRIENEFLREQHDMLRRQVEGLQLRTRFCLQRFAGSDDDIRFYTRFASYQHVQYFWKLVEPAVMTKMIRVSDTKASTAATSKKLPPIDELFLFLMYLSLGLPHRDLAERFSIQPTTVSSIITTWAHFLSRLLGSQRLWLPRGAVRARLPAAFASYPDTQVVVFCSETCCQTPSDLQSLRAVVGTAPHGAVTFVSGLFSGSLSDREIFKQSGIIGVLRPETAIMVDKSFLVGDLAPCRVYRPDFLDEARLRVHVERCVGRVKGNKLFDGVLPLADVGIIDELFGVACYLVNYQNGSLRKP